MPNRTFATVGDEEKERRNPYDADDQPKLHEAWSSGWNRAPELADTHFQPARGPRGEAFMDGLFAHIVVADAVEE
jgi:hypothetical protein